MARTQSTDRVKKVLVTVTERRTYEIEAESEAEAVERLEADPERPPIGSLVSVDRSRPSVVGSEASSDETDHPPDETALDSGADRGVDPIFQSPRAF